MNVIVTNNAVSYKGFVKVAKLQDVFAIQGNIDYLVYHKSNEQSDDKVRHLTELKDMVKMMVYIRDPEDCDKAVQMIVVGSGGRYFDDEFFLESGEELSGLLDNLDEVTAIAELGGVNVLSDFFNRYLDEGSKSTGFNKQYLMVVKDAVEGMLVEYKAKDLELLQLSETATQLFVNSAKLLNGMEKEQENLKETITNLEKVKETIVQPTRVSSGGPSILFFPKVTYMKERNIIRIKEIGDFPYLFSFAMGFKMYLDKIKYLRPKLIICLPVGKMYEEMYKDYHWVTKENASTMHGYYHDMVLTNFPTREVLMKLLDDNEKDTFIVIDRLKTSKDHILNSKGAVPKYAVASTKVGEQMGIKTITSFYTKEIKGSMFSIKHDDSYPEAVEQRERYYLREYASAYELLCSVKR